MADPGFSQGGRQLPKWVCLSIIFAKNCMKMKEFGPGWRHASLTPPLDSPMNYGKTKINVKKSSQLSVVLDDCVALLEHVIIIRISCFDIDFVSQIKSTKPFWIHCFDHGLRFPPTGVDPGFPWGGEGGRAGRGSSKVTATIYLAKIPKTICEIKDTFVYIGRNAPEIFCSGSVTDLHEKC